MGRQYQFRQTDLEWYPCKSEQQPTKKSKVLISQQLWWNCSFTGALPCCTSRYFCANEVGLELRLHHIHLLEECMTLWGKPERVHAHHHCHSNVTQPQATEFQHKDCIHAAYCSSTPCILQGTLYTWGMNSWSTLTVFFCYTVATSLGCSLWRAEITRSMTDFNAGTVQPWVRLK